MTTPIAVPGFLEITLHVLFIFAKHLGFVPHSAQRKDEDWQRDQR
jgi:hypothetical protein